MNNSFKMYFINFKKHVIPILFLLFAIFLVLFSKSNMLAVKNGLSMWINNIIPSLFPFFIAIELINYTDIPKIIGKIFQKIMRPLFNVPGVGAYALFMGIISGYPVGAKIVTNLRNHNLCTKEEGERLLTFTNNSGPLFIIASVGITLFKDTSIGILLLFTHLLSCLTVAFIFRFWKKNTRTSSIGISSDDKTITLNSLGYILSESIYSAIKSIVIIGGFIVFFCVVLSIINKLKIFELIIYIITPIINPLGINSNFIIAFLSGILELTSGVTLISIVPSSLLGINVIIAAFLLGFGGISILLQVWSITSNSDISIKPYLIGKLLQGIIASIYTFLIISNISYFKYLLL